MLQKPDDGATGVAEIVLMLQKLTGWWCHWCRRKRVDVAETGC